MPQSIRLGSAASRGRSANTSLAAKSAGPSKADPVACGRSGPRPPDSSPPRRGPRAAGPARPAGGHRSLPWRGRRGRSCRGRSPGRPGTEQIPSPASTGCRCRRRGGATRCFRRPPRRSRTACRRRRGAVAGPHGPPGRRSRAVWLPLSPCRKTATGSSGCAPPGGNSGAASDQWLAIPGRKAETNEPVLVRTVNVPAGAGDAVAGRCRLARAETSRQARCPPVQAVSADAPRPIPASSSSRRRVRADSSIPR